jgi:hypothetical protein
MIVVQDKFVFLNNPRTGSRAMVQGFINAGAIEPDTLHLHTEPKDIPTDLPRYAIIRNTIDWALSTYRAFKPSESFEEWIKQPFKVLDWAPGRLNAYEGYVDKYFLYEWGLESIIHYLGFEPPTIPLVGARNKDNSLRDSRKCKEAILEKFWKDAELYEQVLKESKPIPYYSYDKNRLKIGPTIREATINVI